MSNQDMITAIMAAIQDQTKLQTLMLAIIQNNLPNLIPQDGSTSPRLQALCAVLGIPTT